MIWGCCGEGCGGLVWVWVWVWSQVVDGFMNWWYSTFQAWVWQWIHNFMSCCGCDLDMGCLLSLISFTCVKIEGFVVYALGMYCEYRVVYILLIEIRKKKEEKGLRIHVYVKGAPPRQYWRHPLASSPNCTGRSVDPADSEPGKFVPETDSVSSSFSCFALGGGGYSFLRRRKMTRREARYQSQRECTNSMYRFPILE